MHVRLYTLAHEVQISLNKLQKLRYKRGLKSNRIQGESCRLHIRINTRKQFLTGVTIKENRVELT